jgi:hypothetical protein
VTAVRLCREYAKNFHRRIPQFSVSSIPEAPGSKLHSGGSMDTNKKTERKKRLEKVKSVRTGIRLNTPAPRILKSGKDYDRKKKKKALDIERTAEEG